MASGLFKNVEEVLVQALESAPLPESSAKTVSIRTGSDLVAAMQAMPYRDEVQFEHSRSHVPIRDVTL